MAELTNQKTAFYIGLDKYNGSGFLATCNSWSANYHPTQQVYRWAILCMCRVALHLREEKKREEEGDGRKGEKREGREVGKEGRGVEY